MISLENTPLFRGIAPQDISAMLNCLGTVKKQYQKGEYVLREGEKISTLALLVQGRLLIQKDDYWGNHSIISMVQEGELFGEAYAMPDSEPLMNDVAALENSVVYYFDVHKVLNLCPNGCPFHNRLVTNLFCAVAQRNRKLAQKLGHMNQRSIREKLMSYLSQQSSQQGSNEFDIPFNRQQLADFLAVDRSAMSRELSQMQEDGLLSFSRNHFILL